ncbi:MAG TPA: hypothetical protein VL475_14255, partial [Planctomycetaceae bacterium]|nr:hypothetical protein [Planctomycetaceae bacterium]
GQSSAGTYLGVNRVAATDWNVTGTISWDGETINWSNGSVWKLNPDLPGDWANAAGQPVGMEQFGSTLVFLNRAGGKSAGRFIDPTHVLATDWGNIVGTLQSDGIHWSNGTFWSPQSLTGTNPELGGLWDRDGWDLRVLQSNGVLTFINRAGGISAGHFISSTQVSADDWNVVGTISGGQISWSNGTIWTEIPNVAGPYLTPTNQEAGVNQLERSLTFTDQSGVVTHGNFVDPTNIVETDGTHRTAVLSGGLIHWSTGLVWTPLANLRGDWALAANGAPTYVAQSGLSVLFVNDTGTLFQGAFINPAQIELTQKGIPSPPVVNVGVTSPALLDFGGGVTWNKTSFAALDSVFSDPDDWSFE